mgnify:CR=1 FL=1
MKGYNSIIGVIEMVWKVFEKGGKWVLVKEKVFKLLRSLDTLGNGDSNVSSLNPAFSASPHEAVLETAGALTYWHELRKAEALLHWQRWLNRPT